MKFIGSKVREIRQKKHISITYIMANLGISRGTLWMWEKGEQALSEKSVRALDERTTYSTFCFHFKRFYFHNTLLIGRYTS